MLSMKSQEYIKSQSEDKVIGFVTQIHLYTTPGVKSRASHFTLGGEGKKKQCENRALAFVPSGTHALFLAVGRLS